MNRPDIYNKLVVVQRDIDRVAAHIDTLPDEAISIDLAQIEREIHAVWQASRNIAVNRHKDEEGG